MPRAGVFFQAYFAKRKKTTPSTYKAFALNSFFILVIYYPEMENLLTVMSYSWRAAVPLVVLAVLKFLYTGFTIRMKYRKLAAQGIVRASPPQDWLVCGEHLSRVL